MKDVYERIKDLAEEVSALEEKVGEDNMSIIIGIADCNTEKATLCCSGVTEGILEMISRTVYQIYGEDSDETERVNGKIS
jgi:hypothetical protein